jgi:hypothetical protein
MCKAGDLGCALCSDKTGKELKGVARAIKLGFESASRAVVIYTACLRERPKLSAGDI